MDRTVLIAGCGLGGATLAIALMQRGFSVRVHEAAGALQELGAGLAIPPSVMRVFDALGLWERVRDITTLQGGMTYVHYRTGEILTGQPDHDWTHRPEHPGQSGHTHRALLHALLVDVMRELDPDCLLTGHRLESFEQDDQGVRIRFANGDTDAGDVLIGADGLHSVTHRQLFGEARPRFTGVVAIRTTIPRDRIARFLTGGRATNFIGPDRGFLRYGVRNGTMVNCVALAKDDRWRDEGWDNRSSRAELLDLYGDWHPNVVGIIEGAPEDGIFKWALYDRLPLSVWSLGRVTLLGDAAHPMLPYLGQGAAQAIEDALVLARALAAHEAPLAAFDAYEGARVARAARMVMASREQAEALNQPDPYAYSARKVDPSVFTAYDPVTVPIR